MHHPPFNSSSLADAMSVGLGARPGLGAAPLRAACCEPAAAGPQHTPQPRRKKLGELNTLLHCSVIGTCLATADLRKLVPRFVAVDRARTSELDLHHLAVELAGAGGPGAKALHKALDERHALAIRRFAGAQDAATLQAGWTEAMKSGDIPGPYWAVMTHPAASAELRQLVFGDVHMLSHLVGAANRADIRRLVALEQENDALKSKLDAQQQRLQAAAVERQAAVGRMQAEVIELHARIAQVDHPGRPSGGDEAAALRDALAERERQVALQTARRERAEQDAAMAQSEVLRLSAELERAHRFVDTLQAELHAMEQQLVDDGHGAAEAQVLPRLAGRRILYVGGRPRSNTALRSLAERHGILLGMHDGGIEDRKGLLGAAIPGVEIVVFPADCIDHDSMNLLKRQCERHGVPYRVLRSASVASFVAAMAALADDSASPSPHFCMRHG